MRGIRVRCAWSGGFGEASAGEAKGNSEGERDLGAHNAAADGIQHQTGGLMNVEFLHQPGAMRLRGFDTDAEQWATSFVDLPSAIS